MPFFFLFLPFLTVTEFSRQEYYSGLPFPSPVDHVWLELFTMTHPSLVALHSVAHSFIELCMPRQNCDPWRGQSYGFSGSHIQMWKLDHKEGWAPKNWCFPIAMLEKTLERPLDCKEIQPVNTKGNQSWIFTGRTDAEAEAPIVWPPDAKGRLIGKDPNAGKDWKQQEKWPAEDETVW